MKRKIFCKYARIVLVCLLTAVMARCIFLPDRAEGRKKTVMEMAEENRGTEQGTGEVCEEDRETGVHVKVKKKHRRNNGRVGKKSGA